MILFRYLFREVIYSMLAVALVLVVIIMSGRFVKYLAEAASGRISADVLLSVMAFRIPSFLELIVPLAFFIAILLAYGRMYMDSEMTVLRACGFSQKRLLGYTLMPALLVATLVATLSLWVSPMGVDRSNTILEEQRKRSEFETLSEAQFQPLKRGKNIIYAQSFNEDRTVMNSVFLAEMQENSDQKTEEKNNTGAEKQLMVVRAQHAEQRIVEEYGRKYFQVTDGVRYSGRPGQQNYTVTEFGQYWQVVEEPRVSIKDKVDRMSTKALLASDDIKAQAALQWRLTLPALVMVVAILAVPLSSTNPRQGRYAKMIPAIVLYLVYLVSLNGGRGSIEDGKLPIYGLWLIHGVFLSIGLFMMGAGSLRQRLVAKGRQVSKGRRANPDGPTSDGLTHLDSPANEKGEANA
ncbi:LPS export ABC transporter permease LptF [Marinibactrum halimedae]|uniref:Lipopolysaccharide export system permease protein LptF n=1 Tax=Marinibactrum halimedae TaxID=1444977 RepID=A0AA37TBU7_9GAMM|nr:LPS export ABC transporter permease LptF [Marinibactrum halimedae]MCD9457952.1 LPS export ABC transporter permease LptF [Marinibactrum halimedae]GLS26217.1 LPS export ABC transporter permease LptF [Marinibactrum halimedae]